MTSLRSPANGLERTMGEAGGDSSGRLTGEPGGEVRTPQGTMLVVLVYVAITVVLWGYVYYGMIRFQGIAGGH